MASSGDERLSNVRFDNSIADSKYVNPKRMHFTRRGRQQFWDMALERDSVSCILYHTGQKKIVLVKQFRPPVFVHTIRALPENVDKDLATIDWTSYPLRMGETVELCAGLIDKPGKGPLEHIQEEIHEECGYDVSLGNIQFIMKYMTGISLSGTAQFLYFAKIDDSMKVSEGGGNESESEYIEKVFLDLEETKGLVAQGSNVLSPPSLLFAICWFLNNYESLIGGK